MHLHSDVLKDPPPQPSYPPISHTCTRFTPCWWQDTVTCHCAMSHSPLSSTKKAECWCFSSSFFSVAECVVLHVVAETQPDDSGHTDTHTHTNMQERMREGQQVNVPRVGETMVARVSRNEKQGELMWTRGVRNKLRQQAGWDVARTPRETEMHLESRRMKNARRHPGWRTERVDLSRYFQMVRQCCHHTLTESRIEHWLHLPMLPCCSPVTINHRTLSPISLSLSLTHKLIFLSISHSEGSHWGDLTLRLPIIPLHLIIAWIFIIMKSHAAAQFTLFIYFFYYQIRMWMRERERERSCHSMLCLVCVSSFRAVFHQPW